MSKKVTSIRGMNDILPQDTPLWRWLETRIERVLSSYGYAQIRMPLVESTDLFKRSIGEVTDIVEKEMYTFEDRNGDSLTLRPEGTASCVRAAEQAGLLFNQVQKLWYAGPMFRHERPQAGRYRQFHQTGAEVFGLAGPDIDAEMILMTARLWRELGLADKVELQLNSLGESDDRARYRDALVAYLKQHEDRLDEDSRRRLERNPLRVLDSKDAGTQQVLEGAPALADYLGEEARAHFDGLRQLLDAAGLRYVINPRLVRGLDYYGKTVFEWVTSALGAQGTVCAGGRYDGLVAQLGGRATPAVGFAMGMERLVLLLAQQAPELKPAVDVYVMAPGQTAAGLALAEALRDALPNLAIEFHSGGGSVKSQMKKADKSGARLAVILGEDELAAGEVSLNLLRDDQPQQRVASSELAGVIGQLLAAG